MLCKSCRRTLLARLLSQSVTHSSRISLRTVATVPASNNAAPKSPPASTASSKTADQTSAAVAGNTQPFSEPFFPSTTNITSPPASATNPSVTAPVKLTSSVPGGTPFAHLSYFKQPPKPVVALEDHEYPAWLWTLVADPNAPKSSLDGGVDLSAMSKKTRAKYERKQAKMLANMEKPIPLHEQSKDLTEKGDSAEVHAEKMRELTQSMRQARRKGIREANFLRSM